MEVDNFERIIRLLTFESEDEFYFMQILRRKKENVDMEANNFVVKTFYVKSAEELMNLKSDVVFLCKHYNARAYINLNVKSFKKVTLATIKDMVQRVCDDNYAKPYKIFDSECGQCAPLRDKRWVVDFDYKDGFDDRKISDAVNFIDRECQPEGVKFIACLSTKNGKHVITTPFDLKKFKDEFPLVDVHKNNPTLLYCC